MQSEVRFPVQGLGLPDPARQASADLLQFSAVQLFLAGARRAQPGFELTADNRDDVVRICHLVQGMPLGILLAATWLEMLRPGEIAAEIATGLDFLEADWRDVPPRQRGMRAVLDHSWRLLTEREREAMQALSVFRGGFTRQAAQQVAGVSLRGLMALLDKSLLRRAPVGSRIEGAGDRYDLWHELLCQYGEEKLAQAPDGGKAVRDRHSAYFVEALERWGTELKNGRVGAVLPEITAEFGDARAAWDWVVQTGEVERLGRAAETLGLYYLYNQRHREGDAALQAAEGRLRGTRSANGLLSLARLLLARSWFVSLAEGPSLLERCRALLERPELADLDTRAERAVVLNKLANQAFNYDYEKAVQLYEQCLALYREIGDRFYTGGVLQLLANSSRELGRLDQARRYAEEKLAFCQDLGVGAQAAAAEAYTVLADTAVVQGQIEEAKRLNDEALAI